MRAEEYDANNVRKWKLNLQKNHCERWRAYITTWCVKICVIAAFHRHEKLKIKRVWQINHPVLLTQPPSLSEVSKYFVHNLFIFNFSMNYADSEYFRTSRDFHDILCTCINIL